MKIDFGKYVLVTDSLNMWIEEKHKSSKGKMVSKRVSGYHQDYSDLLESFTRKKIKSIDKQSVADALKEFAQIENELRNLARELGKELK